MAEDNGREAIPDRFDSLREAADFWDNHDVAAYDDQTREVHFDVDLRKRTFLTALEPDLAKRVAAYAHQRGVSTETLINIWLTEKLATAMSSG